MKISLITCLVCLLSFSAFAQDYPDLPSKKLTSKADYAEAEPLVLASADYLLSAPSTTPEVKRLACSQYILLWMEGTDKYTFSLGPDFLDFAKGNNDLGQVYLASLAKVAIENSEQDPEAINSAAREVFLNFCEEPANGIKKNKAIKKALKARKQ